MSISERTISIHTDGSCLSNPGPGGWGMAVKDSEKQEWDEYSEPSYEVTTNNRQELSAGLNGIRLAKSFLASNDQPRVILYSDSEYFTRGVNNWAESWRLKNFKGVKNSDLWKQIIAEYDEVAGTLSIVWEKGHADSEGNRRADLLARKASKISSAHINNKT